MHAACPVTAPRILTFNPYFLEAYPLPDGVLDIDLVRVPGTLLFTDLSTSFRSLAQKLPCPLVNKPSRAPTADCQCPVSRLLQTFAVEA